MAFRLSLIILGLLTLSALSLRAQEARIKAADEWNLPAPSDGNSAVVWHEGRLVVFTSDGATPRVSYASAAGEAWETHRVRFTNLRDRTVWIESAWVDASGAILAWYHHEPWGMYEDSLLTAPSIGAAVSRDGGRTFSDLGIVLSSGDPLDDDAENGYFTGGHGDFTVVPDQEGKFFYFIFTNYGGPPRRQGIALARLAFEDRFEPEGKVRKYFEGEWDEPGLGGRVTPVLPATRAWRHRDPQSFWGPSVHWNTHLRRHVVLLNRTSGQPGWAQDGIFISYVTDLADPESWTKPVKLLDGEELPGTHAFYPQVIGLESEGTDSVAGRIARLFIHGSSKWEIEFRSTASGPLAPSSKPAPADIVRPDP
jgi:hypothetical protein